MKRKRGVCESESVSGRQLKVPHHDTDMAEIHRRTTQIVMDAARKQSNTHQHAPPPATPPPPAILQPQPQLQQHQHPQHQHLQHQQHQQHQQPVPMQRFRDISSFFTSVGGHAAPTQQVSLPAECIGCWVCGVSIISHSHPIECQGCTRKICNNCKRHCTQCLLHFCSCCTVCE